MEVIPGRFNLIFHAEAPAFDDDRLGVVQDPVEDGGGQRAVIIEDLRPVLVGAVGGDHHRRALVALADDLEEQIGAELVDGQVAELVDDEQAGLEITADLALEPPSGLRCGERVDDVDGGGEERGVAADAGGAAEGKGNVRLAEADGRDEDDVGVGWDEGQAEQVLYLGPIDLLWPVPLKVFHRLEDGEVGVLDAPLDGAGLAPSGLTLDQLGQIGDMRELLLGGCGGERLAVVFYVGEVQGIELRVQAYKITR